MPLIVTGSIGIDTVETPTEKVPDTLGGSSIYFAAAASFFGPVRLVGAVGEDFPDHFIDHFKAFDIDLTGLEKRAGSKTFRWHGKYHENMNHRETLEVHLNVLAEALPPIPESYQDSEYVFLATTHPANQLSLINSFPKRKITVMDTIDFYIQSERDGLIEVIKQIDGIVINDEEAAMLTDEDNIIKAADKIVEMGPTFVVIKKGEHGAMCRHRDGFAALPAFPTGKVSDPTGAGDSFAGGMLGYLSSTGGDTSLPAIRAAMGYGTVCASYNIESFSVERLKQIGKADIDQRFTEYRQMLNIGG